ncbi:hypothetical protein NK718_20835 [Alsobacter sp. SYSU M60028]|uniref:Yip1 domain-containing protein n=1 Tax=Alsobacter ponti TaxID=2962936 RepID=A0ABT1LIL7_9HYPH|nr:hypothetical protein [Alsobacter ponti]MCP8940978.1 hypothetical protein [Alsobacter ponti]
MLLTADEVGRSLAGSLKLMNRDPAGLKAFDVSVEAFWRSFAAILLTAPAFVVSLARDRAELGLPPQDGLFADPWVVALQAGALGLAWVAFPVAMILVARRLGLGRRYAGFVIAYNWSAVLAALIFAVPDALLLVGAATPGLAALFALAFGIIIAHYRWFLARAALGVTSLAACGIVMLDFGLNYAVASVLEAVL